MIRMLKSLFGRKMIFLCPWCIKSFDDVPADLSACPHCGSSVPNAYTSCLDDAPGLFVPIIGWTSTGKTEVLNTMPPYLAALNQAIDRLTCRHVMPASFEEADRQAETALTGRGRVGTDQLGPPRAYRVGNFGIWGNRTLVFRDCKGEFFHHWAVGGDEGDRALMGDILRRSPVTILTISVADIRRALRTAAGGDEEVAAGTAGRPARARGQTDPFLLLNTYLTTVNAQAGKKRNKSDRHSLVVMLTKADLLKDVMPAAVQNYLATDPFTRHALPPDMDTIADGVGSWAGLPKSDHPTDDILTPWDNARCRLYLERMEAVSDSIKGWFRGVHSSYKMFVTTAEECGINLRFCANSAGEERNDLLYPMPRRVVDPLIWAMELTSGRLAR